VFVFDQINVVEAEMLMIVACSSNDNRSLLERGDLLGDEEVVGREEVVGGEGDIGAVRFVVVGDVLVARLDFGDEAHELVERNVRALEELVLVQEEGDRNEEFVVGSEFPQFEHVEVQLLHLL